MVELRLLSGGAAHGLVTLLAGAFEAETGDTIEGTFGAVGAMRARLDEGQPADLVILTQQIVEDLSRAGDVIPDSVADVGGVQTAMAIRSGDQMVAVESVSGLEAALRNANEVHFPDPSLATAGIHFNGVLERLGLKQSMAGAIRLHPNGMTAMQALAASTARRPLGCTQATEIIAVSGVSMVAPLPAGLDLTTVYTVAVCTRSSRIDAARRLAGFLTSADSSPQRRICGFA